MRIKIPKHEFLRQLKIVEIKKLPDVMYLDGDEVDPPVKQDLLAEKYPKLPQILSSQMYKVVKELYQEFNNPIPRTSLYKYFLIKEGWASNSVAVCVYTINKIFNKKRIPLVIKSIASGSRRGYIFLTNK